MKLLDLANVILYRVTILFIKIRIALQFKLKLTKAYQPSPFGERSQQFSGRECQSRFDDINKCLPSSALSALDIGCNEGYFIFRMAERGGFCHGIDMGRNEIMVADGLAKINKINNVSFSNAKIDLEYINGLPHYDVIIFMSVFHHIARHEGLKYAEKFMLSLSSINIKYLIFETGQPNELNTTWANDLNFMLPDIESWITEMLKRSGYKKINVIGKNHGVYSEVNRLLFLAEK